MTIAYDTLVVAVGAVPNTFGVPGVHENAMFLKDTKDGQRVRGALHDAFEAASYPHIQERERRALLTFVVVGGGPTGVEFAGELTVSV